MMSIHLYLVTHLLIGLYKFVNLLFEDCSLLKRKGFCEVFGACK